jgi:hypothetical protein
MLATSSQFALAILGWAFTLDSRKTIRFSDSKIASLPSTEIRQDDATQDRRRYHCFNAVPSNDCCEGLVCQSSRR